MNHNSLFSFQATPNNVEEIMIDGRPYSDIPFTAQTIAKQIGGDFQHMRVALQREETKKLNPVRSFMPQNRE